MKVADLHPFSAGLDAVTALTAKHLLSLAGAHPQIIDETRHSDTFMLVRWHNPKKSVFL